MPKLGLRATLPGVVLRDASGAIVEIPTGRAVVFDPPDGFELCAGLIVEQAPARRRARRSSAEVEAAASGLVAGRAFAIVDQEGQA